MTHRSPATFLTPCALALACAVLLAPRASGAPPVPADSVAAPPAPSGLVFRDVPNDFGGAIDLHWRLAPGDSGPGGPVRGYVLLRAPQPGGPWADLDSVGAGVDSLRDATVRPGHSYLYRVAATGPGGRTLAGAAAGPAVPRVSWLLVGELGLAAAVLLAALVLLARRARKQKRTGQSPPDGAPGGE